jgi:hypothetical protein
MGGKKRVAELCGVRLTWEVAYRQVPPAVFLS